MIVNKKGDIEYLTFESFDKTGLVKHCFSTRKGGVSEGVYESMNLSFRKDKRENVIENYRLLCEAIGADYRNVVFSDQVHEDRLYIVTKEDCGKGLLRESDITGYDGLITNESGVVLTTFYADCVPLYFLDKKKKVIALTHSGWKGTVKEIGRKSVEKMREKFGCECDDIIAGIGPSIGGCCFQVDMPVVEEFRKAFEFADRYIVKDESAEGKYKIDLKGINKEIMMKSGIKEENIEVSDNCTKCRGDIFFSHRNMGSERGSLAALMCLGE
ncbi:MAG: peptidoglycan editing factor PgeF [Firmicutes bacterium]|nr:peptidoglycan editing factor PgeF [Bacillota bacterium]